MKRSLGKMSKRSRLLRRRVSASKLGLTQLIKSFKVGDSVVIDFKSGHFSGMPHPRYRGKQCTVIGKRGTAYVVELWDYAMKKSLVVPAVHLEKA